MAWSAPSSPEDPQPHPRPPTTTATGTVDVTSVASMLCPVTVRTMYV